MLDGLTFDQLRTFIAAVDAGSFSAAGRRLGRAQSVVSQTLLNLELQTGLKLFDRSGRYPRLTDAGHALVHEARLIADRVDSFKARAQALQEGLEPELSVVIDVVYPMTGITKAVGLFRGTFPQTTLRLYVEALGAAIQPVLERRCVIGIVGTLPLIPHEVESIPLLEVPFLTVASPQHPLAELRGVIPRGEVAKHVQLVLTDRTSLSAGRDFGVLSPQTWRLADLGAKHAFLRAGFGWGQMPRSMVADDVRNGVLVKLDIEGLSARTQVLPMHAIYRKDAPPGPAGRALIDWFKSHGTPATRSTSASKRGVTRKRR
jgi:DNA-binding transcriptional LysR family regulator